MCRDFRQACDKFLIKLLCFEFVRVVLLSHTNIYAPSRISLQLKRYLAYLVILQSNMHSRHFSNCKCWNAFECTNTGCSKVSHDEKMILYIYLYILYLREELNQAKAKLYAFKMPCWHDICKGHVQNSHAVMKHSFQHQMKTSEMQHLTSRKLVSTVSSNHKRSDYPSEPIISLASDLSL